MKIIGLFIYSLDDFAVDISLWLDNHCYTYTLHDYFIDIGRVDQSEKKLEDGKSYPKLFPYFAEHNIVLNSHVGGPIVEWFVPTTNLNNLINIGSCGT